MGGRMAWVGVLLGALFLGLVAAPSAAACSPPFGQPTIAGLGPHQLVLLGWTGDPAPDARFFHVERAWNGEVPTSPIVIAFKEGEPIGDCSYPVSRGQHLVIAPDMEPGGRLSASLVTLQADPNTDDGTRYLAEAEALCRGCDLVPRGTTSSSGCDRDHYRSSGSVLTAMIVGTHTSLRSLRIR